MQTYAILGATGTTGSEITRLLLGRQALRLKLYARSQDKLRRCIPELELAKNIEIFTGSIADPHIMISCLRDADVIFMTVGTNSNKPGTCITQDVCKAIANALLSIRSETMTTAAFPPPTIVFLASTVTANSPTAHQPWFIRQLIFNASSYVYNDHIAALKYLETELPWVPLIKASPAALVEDVASGFRLEPHGNSSLTCSYKDLAAAMITMVEDPDRDWVGMDPGIVSLGKPRYDILIGVKLPFYVIPGNIVTWLPWLYPILHKLGCLQ